MTTLEAPYFPIIYVRGYAMTQSEIASTVSTPYMGFNLGSTKARQTWSGEIYQHIFESPLVRLMKDYDYRDIYNSGQMIEGKIPAKSVAIYRYYDTADKDFGDGRTLSIDEAAKGLKDFIYRIREQVCENDETLLKQFKVHLVAHSMGGLVCRAFLQNDSISTPEDRALVHKVFTYATPHNGIELAGINVPAVLGLWDMNNFNRKKMREFLGLKKESERVDMLDNKFDPQRFFCFVGTNHRDYDVALGITRRLAGEMSDGLVMIKNATIRDAPRAFAFRSHSGPYGVVNSEEGYQNLVRFLFGNIRIDGTLEVESLPLPLSVQKAKDKGKEIRGSYYFEATVAVRGEVQVRLTERRRETFNAVLRSYDELMKHTKLNLTKPRSPRLFSAFLDERNVVKGKTIVFSVEITVSTTGYTIDRLIWDQHIEGEYLFRDTLTLRATPTPDGWTLRFVFTDENWSDQRGTIAPKDGNDYIIPITSKKGFKGQLRISIQQAA